MRQLLFILFLTPSFLVAQTFTNYAPEWNIIQYDWDGIFGAGVTAADWNLDGWDDLTFGNTSGAVRTFVNTGGDGFEMIPLPVTQNAETKALQWLDIDNDGDLDFYISDVNGAINILENIGDTVFVNVTDGTNIPQDETAAAGASWGDYDRDGDLDLHICRYVESFNNQLGPEYRNILMRNDGGFAFTNVTEESSMGEYVRLSFQSIWFDWDGDGWQDLYIINDKNGANTLYHNQQNGQFFDVAPSVGAALVLDAMTASLGDFNQDGHQDIFMTSTVIGNEYIGSQLLLGSSSGQFQEASIEHGLNFVRNCWGAAWMDVDNDTDLDLFVAESEVLNPFQDNFLYENLGAYVFDDPFGSENDPFNFEPFSTDVYATDLLNSNTVVTGDFDRNGWIDFVVHNTGNHKARIWMNSGFGDIAPHYFQMGLQGNISNTMGVGTFIELSENGLTQIRTTHCGENYLGQESFYEHFGLGGTDGSPTSIDSLKLTWTSGVVDQWYDVADFERHVFVEGTSACEQFDNTAVTLCGTEETSFEIITHWESADVVWHFQATAINEPLTLTAEANAITVSAQGTYTASVYHLNTLLCETTVEIIVTELTFDLTENGNVGSDDVLLFLTYYGCQEDCIGDFNNDGSTTAADLLSLLVEYGSGC